MQRGIKLASRFPVEATKYFASGAIDKFASRNIRYRENNNRSNAQPASEIVINDSKEASAAATSAHLKDETLTQNYKILSPNNLVVNSNSPDYDRHIKRPVPKNVHSIPVGTEFFICIADIQLHVNSPHKWLRLLPDVVISNHFLIRNNIACKSINELLEILLDAKMICESPKDMRDEDIMILVNGGLPTRYVVANLQKFEPKNFFLFCKRIHPFAECYVTQHAIILSQTYGVPFRAIQSRSEQFFLSPLDMANEFMKPFRQELYPTILGDGCPDNLKKYFPYSIPAKVHSVFTYNNRFVSSRRAADYFSLTSDPSFVFIDDVVRRTDGEEQSVFQHENSTMRLNTIYSCDPHLTADGYILSDKIAMSTVFMQQCHIEFDFNVKTDTIQMHEDFFENVIWSYDAFGKPIRRLYLVMTVVRRSFVNLRYNLLKHIKLLVKSQPFNDGWICYFYKFYDEEPFLDKNANFDISLNLTTMAYRRIVKSMSLSILTKLKQNVRFSGQKFYDVCGQKGLVVPQSTARFQKLHKLPYEPDIIVSLFSAVGRIPLISLKSVVNEQNKLEREIRDSVLCGSCEYVLLKNHSSVFCSFGYMRVDIAFNKICCANNLNKCIYGLQQDERNPGAVLPYEANDAVGMYGLIKVQFQFEDESGSVHNSFESNFQQKCLKKPSTATTTTTM